jgi:histidinol-phosphatase (PHP family)
MKIDTHIHTEFSSDSTIKIKELIDKALNKNYSYICITEHFDLLPDEIMHYGLPSLLKYYNTIQNFRKNYPDITIGFGIELGEPHRISQLKEIILQDLNFDYIIGSLHVLKSKKNMSTPINFTLQDSDIMQYYEEIIEIINMGGFDTLGHLGIFKREIKDPTTINESLYLSYLNRIFKLMISKDICLEVNYSGYRSLCNSTIPNLNELKLYKSLGGKMISIGSDSHNIDFFDKFYDRCVNDILNAGFESIYYKFNNIWHSHSIKEN